MSTWLIEVRNILHPTQWHASADCPNELSAQEARVFFARMLPEQRPQYRARNIEDGSIRSAAEMLRIGCGRSQPTDEGSAD